MGRNKLESGDKKNFSGIPMAKYRVVQGHQFIYPVQTQSHQE